MSSAAEDYVREITNFPPIGKYHHNLPHFTATQFTDIIGPGHQPKFIVVGDPGVGKTCLANFMKSRIFQSNYAPTVGTAFLQIKYVINGKETSIAVWDTAGAEKMNALSRQFYRGANVALLCFDLSVEMSFKNASIWHKQIRENCSPSVIVFLVGCKADIQRRAVGDEQIENYCKTNKVEYWATSAKEGTQVSNLLMRAAVTGIYAITEETTPTSTARTVDLNQHSGQRKENEKSGCC
jgi:small GTP-binding protein